MIPIHSYPTLMSVGGFLGICGSHVHHFHLPRSMHHAMLNRMCGMLRPACRVRTKIYIFYSWRRRIKSFRAANKWTNGRRSSVWKHFFPRSGMVIVMAPTKSALFRSDNNILNGVFGWLSWLDDSSNWLIVFLGKCEFHTFQTNRKAFAWMNDRPPFW